MLNIILSGAPGSGKGTQSDLLVKHYGLEHLSTGDVLRREIASGSKLGAQIDAIISKGNLVPDGAMIALINSYFDNLAADARGVIFDGFPRTLKQAMELDRLLVQRNEKAIMIDLQVPEDELIARILNRGRTSGRADDNLEAAKQRLEVFHEQTIPVALHYKELGKLHSINGLGSVDDIFSRISKVVEEYSKLRI